MLKEIDPLYITGDEDEYGLPILETCDHFAPIESFDFTQDIGCELCACEDYLRNLMEKDD